jgi:predicted transcriptional regulator
MTVELPKKVEEDLRILAQRQGRSIDVLLEEAIEQYLEVVAITDTTPGEVAATQEVLLGELTNIPEWGTEET